MKKNLISLFVCTLVSISAWAGTDGKNVRAVKLTGQEVKIAKENKRKYIEFILDDNLISKQSVGEQGLFVHKYSNTEWNQAEAELTIGKNDGILWPVYVCGSDNSLLRLDTEFGTRHLQKLTVVPNSKSIEALNDSLSWIRYDLSKLPELSYGSSNFVLTPDSMLLVGGFPKSDEKHILTIVDFKNNKLIPLDYWPDDGINDVPDIFKNDVYVDNSDIFGNGQGHYLYKGYDRRNAFIFTIDNDNVKIVKSLYANYPKYKVTPPPFLRVEGIESCKWGLECTVNNQHIALLLTDSDINGTKYKEIYTLEEGRDLSPYIYGNVVELYDWDGNKQKVIYLDHYGSSIIVSDDGKKLLLFADDYIKNIHKIWSYDLSNIDNLPQVDIEEMEKARAIHNVESSVVKDSAEPVNALKEGDMMVDFELYDYDDKPHHLNEFLGKGKYIVLEFSSLTCGPCQMVKPLLEKFYKRHKDKFEMITISGDREKPWKQKPNGEVSWHEWNDHNMGADINEKYGIIGIPTFVIIDSEGKILRKCTPTSAFLDALKELIPTEEVDKLLKE